MNLWFEMNEWRKVENTRSMDCNKECQKISPHNILTGERRKFATYHWTATRNEIKQQTDQST